jgi:hypothetical protein
LIFIKNNLMSAGMVKVPIKTQHVPNVVLKDVNLMGTQRELDGNTLGTTNHDRVQ